MLKQLCFSGIIPLLFSGSIPRKIFGKKFKSSRPPSKTAEALIIQDFVDKHEKKPIGCTQK